LTYGERLDALAAVWRRWAEVGDDLTDTEWGTPSRCAGWDVAALFAHVGMFPQAVLDPPQAESGEPATAADILRGFNAPSGVAHTMAEQVARAAVAVAAEVGPPGLVALFADTGPLGIAELRSRPSDGLVPWPAAAAVTTWAEATRIVLLESTVHLLDVLDGLGRPPELPAAALREAAHLLADLADPVAFVEAATGRSSRSPLPVLR
jgi:uncharacterized protein (TIGR03083 family)